MKAKLDERVSPKVFLFSTKSPKINRDISINGVWKKILSYTTVGILVNVNVFEGKCGGA